MNKPIQILCKTCGSTDVRRDAYASWSVENQEWELAQVFDQGYCENCGGEVSLIEAELSPLKVTTIQKVVTTFPLVKDFDDYHEIPFYADTWDRCKSAEIAFGPREGEGMGRYWGLFWIGKKPGKAQIRQLLKDADFDFNPEGYGPGGFALESILF